MDVETLLAEHDPVRRQPVPRPDSAGATALYQQIIRSDTPVPSPAAGHRRRILITAVSGAAAASAIALAVVLTSVSAVPAPGTRLDASLTARQVLDKAAAAASAQPAVTPRPDQFFYTRQRNVGGYPSYATTQYWWSIDGERDSLTVSTSAVIGRHGVTPGCVGGRQVFTNIKRYKPPSYTGPDTVSEPCTPVLAYLPAMPASPGPLLSYLQQTGQVQTHGYPGKPWNHATAVDSLAGAIDGMLLNDYLLPAQRAALYQLLAQTQGITVVPQVTDVDGRAGVGVRWSYRGTTSTLIFSTASYQFLGMSSQDPGGSVSGIAVLKTAIVNQAGQQP